MLDKTIKQSIDFLDQEQQEDGSFLSYSSSIQNNFSKAKKYHSTFPASLILNCLCSCSDALQCVATSKIKQIKQRLVKFLLSQKSNHWSFNYWTRDSKETKTMPYPDDLDDTFVALAGIFRAQPKLIDGSAMAKIVTVLTSVEEKEGGPYKTWIVPKAAEKVWKDVDLAVNSNVAYFLSLQKVSLKNINKLIEKAIDNENYTSPYYPSIYPVIYFISQYYRGDKVNQIRDFLLSKRDQKGGWGNVLNTALAVSALLNFGIDRRELEKSVEYLTEPRTMRYGAQAFCLDPAIKGKKQTAGSRALTTAFCLEALAKYSQAKSSKKLIKNKSKVSPGDKFIYYKVIKKAKQKFSSIGGDLEKQFLKILKIILDSKSGWEIVLLPDMFRSSLSDKDSKKITDDFVIKLGLSSLFGWIAYTIYDDFLDEEGDIKMLSVANICMREMNHIFTELLPKKSGFKPFAEEILDQIDHANAWEVCRCRFKKNESRRGRRSAPSTTVDFGDYSQLAQKSFGHALGPIAILFSLGYNKESKEIKNLIKFFKNYLIARQLNDDAHDWSRDLKKGQVNAVGSLVLKSKNSRCLTSDVTSQMNKLEQIFWYEVSPKVFEKMKVCVEEAREALKNISVIKKPEVLEKLFVPIEFSIGKALREREESIKFLKTYSS